MSFNVNDKVTVVDSGKQYSSYGGWIETYAKQWISQWKRRQSIDTSLEYTVVAKGKHERSVNMLYLIQCDDKVYIIGEQGIKAVKTVAKSWETRECTKASVSIPCPSMPSGTL